MLPGNSMLVRYPVIVRKNSNSACIPAFMQSVLKHALRKKPQHYNKGFWTPAKNIIAFLRFLTTPMSNQPTTMPNNH